MADAPDLGSGLARGMGSSPFLGKYFDINKLQRQAKLCINTRSHRVPEFVLKFAPFPKIKQSTSVFGPQCVVIPVAEMVEFDGDLRQLFTVSSLNNGMKHPERLGLGQNISGTFDSKF